MQAYAGTTCRIACIYPAKSVKQLDNIFADWAVLDRINQAQAQVEDTRAQICAVLDRLGQMTDQAERERAGLRQEIEGLVSSVPM